MPAFEAVLFDFDGVLVDSEPIHFRCWRDLLTPHGIALDWETYRSNYIGVSTREMLEHICHEAANGTTPEILLRLIPRKRVLFIELMCRELPLAPECHAMLSSLSGLRLGVVTSSNRSEVEPVLAAAGIRASFDVLVCGSDVRAQKPSPEPYLKAVQLLGTSAALAVEDSDAGAESAQAAGLEVIRVAGPTEVRPALRERLSHQRQ
jgi:HAD superfamily hydrolase (TIGR01509 family)